MEIFKFNSMSQFSYLSHSLKIFQADQGVLALVQVGPSRRRCRRKHLLCKHHQDQRRRRERRFLPPLPPICHPPLQPSHDGAEPRQALQGHHYPQGRPQWCQAQEASRLQDGLLPPQRLHQVKAARSARQLHLLPQQLGDAAPPGE